MDASNVNSQNKPRIDLDLDTVSLEEGASTYRNFILDNVLHSEEGDIHFNLCVPSSYDGSDLVALFITLPGYQGLYFQGIGENLETEDFPFEAQNYDPNMIIVAAQQLREYYQERCVSEDEIAGLVTLDVKDAAYFERGGVSNQHGGDVIVSET